MSRTRRVLNGVGYGYLNTALVTVAGLWLTPLLLSRLGSHDLGLWFVAQQVLGYLLLLDLGVVALLPRETAYATGLAGGSAAGSAVPEVFGRTQRLAMYQTPFVAAGAALLYFGLPAAWSPLAAPLALVLAAFVLLFPARVWQGLLFGLQDFSFLGRAQLAAWAASTVLMLVLLFQGWRLYALALSWIALQVVLTGACWLRARTRFAAALPAALPPLTWTAVREHSRKGVWVSTSQIAQVFLNGTDLLILGRMLGPAAVVSYACTAKLVTVLANQPQLIMQTAAPALSELRTGESPERLARASGALTHATLLVSGGVACVVAAVNGAFVSWWVGPSQYGGFRLTLLLIAGMLLRHWNTTTVYALFSRGYEKRISITTLADGMTTVAAAAIGVHLLGAEGAALGPLAGTLLVGLPANVSALARDSGCTRRRLVLPLAPWAVRCGLVLAVAAAVALAWRPAGFAGVAAGAGVVGLAYAAIAGPVAFRAPLGQYLGAWRIPFLARWFAWR
jgi:O-antigen/teichoic acid export membrane protein